MSKYVELILTADDTGLINKIQAMSDWLRMSPDQIVNLAIKTYLNNIKQKKEGVA